MRRARSLLIGAQALGFGLGYGCVGGLDFWFRDLSDIWSYEWITRSLIQSTPGSKQPEGFLKGSNHLPHNE